VRDGEDACLPKPLAAMPVGESTGIGTGASPAHSATTASTVNSSKALARPFPRSRRCLPRLSRTRCGAAC